MKIPGYNIEREIGHGGMSTVYLAQQKSLDRPVALKIMAPVLAADRNFGERFLKEGRIVAQLSHPNILGIYDIGQSNHHYYMAMEYVSGGDLKQRIRQGKIDPSQALEIVRQVADALGHAHIKGFVHRDVKPENILFRDDGSVVLSDFGIAKAVGSGTKMTGTGLTIGTAHYMSPEQARGKKVDGRSDLYSLGVVLFEMFTGRVPYDSQDSFAVGFAHINDPIPQLPHQHSAYQRILDLLMAKTTEQRYQRAGDLIVDIYQELNKIKSDLETVALLQMDVPSEQKAHVGKEQITELHEPPKEVNDTRKEAKIPHPKRNLIISYLLWLFLGVFGAHRYYLERTRSGVLYTFTCGLFFSGWIVDFFLIPHMCRTVDSGLWYLRLKKTFAILFTMLILALTIRTFAFQAFKINGGAMLNTLVAGDRILINKFIYGTHAPFTDNTYLKMRDPARGDVIVFEFPADEDKSYYQRRNVVSRIIGIPGDIIEIKAKQVFVNGALFNIPQESHKDKQLIPSEASPRDYTGPVKVPADSYFVMGDNRDYANDSRFWGFVHKSKILGYAFVKFWSWNHRAALLEKVRWDRIGRSVD